MKPKERVVAAMLHYLFIYLFHSHDVGKTHQKYNLQRWFLGSYFHDLRWWKIFRVSSILVPRFFSAWKCKSLAPFSCVEEHQPSFKFYPVVFYSSSSHTWVLQKEGEKAVIKEKETENKKDGEDTLDAKMKRAMRFGLPLSDEELKRKRAERFVIALAEFV